MKRTGSASCLLKPKQSLSQDELHKEALTATVLTVNKLPPYVTDRLYILSELQVHAHSIQFLRDREIDGAKPSLPSSIILYMRWKPDTYPTPLSFADGPLSERVRQCLIANGDDAPLDQLQLVRSRPREIPYSPRRQSQSYDDLPDKTPLPFSVPTGSGSMSKPESKLDDEVKHGEQMESSQLTNIYVVVDRICPESGNDHFPDLPDLSCTSYESIRRGEESQRCTEKMNDNTKQQFQSEEHNGIDQIVQHNNEMKIVKSLARAIASSRFLRGRIDGVTIGLTSDSSAAPGLEACMDAVARGAKERRRASVSRRVEKIDKEGRRERALRLIRDLSPERSPIAIVACDPDDLECDYEHSHHHHHHLHDADTKILQSRIITEWNGKGDYETFVDRAMDDWREAWSVSSGDGKGKSKNGIYQGKTRPKVPRISRSNIESEYEEEIDFDEHVSTIMIIALLGGIMAYTWKTYGDDIYSFLIETLK